MMATATEDETVPVHAKKKVAKKKAATNGQATKGAKAAKKGTKKKATPSGEVGEITGKQVRVLDCLKTGKPLTRSQMAEKTGIEKGWSKMLGASTKEDGGMAGDSGLEARGYVKVEKAPEGERSLRYSITSKGKQALEKAKKAEKE